MAFVICTTAILFGQTGYHVSHYTSKQGLPQNSIRGLAFDQHGFLWLATEGGIARFDGQQFTLISEDDHPGLRNQRFTHLLPYRDTSMLFIDHLNGMYILSNDRFTTLRDPDASFTDLVRVLGSLPSAEFIIHDTFFLEESARAKYTAQYNMTVLPMEDGKVLVVSDRIVVLDLKKKKRKVISPVRKPTDQFARIGNTLLKIDARDQFVLLRTDGNPFEKCRLINDDGTDWKGSLKGTRLFSQYPFDAAFLKAGNRLYKISHGPNRLTFELKLLIDMLPENLNINAIDYRKSDDVLAVGTDAKGLYIYQRQNISTYLPAIRGKVSKDSYYSQSILDSTTILTGNNLLLDITSFKAKGAFNHSINEYLLATDNNGKQYFTQGIHLFKYDPFTTKKINIHDKTDFTTHSITLLEDTIWVGTNIGAGQIIGDTIRWAFKSTFSSNHYGIKSICKDHEGNLWFGSYFELYRFNRSSGQLDSFPTFENTDIRILTLIRDKLFVGTYGHGYYVFDNGLFTAMPKGRQNELSNPHTFIEDKEGYLWISTNRGLYKTHLDAVDAFLVDTTLQLDYYAYLEEDGIINTEFNGGCSPTHLVLPDGRYSLPSLEGLVVFTPEQTPHYFSKDSVVIDYVEVDGQRYRPEELNDIVANHSNIRVHYASAWWNRPTNQYMYLGMEGPEEEYRLSDVNQSSYSLGHLKPGKHTFEIRRRCGFGAEDFVYSRLHFTVEKPWYARAWAILLFAFGLLMLIWVTSVLNSRSIRRRNMELQRKVGEQTKALLASNIQLEENVTKLALSEVNLRKNISVRDRLISIITHDILTPLRFIGQIARLGTEEKPADQGLTKRALTDVQNAVHKLFHSTQNLLHWVTYHQEQFKTSNINCSPFALAEQLMEDFNEMSRFQGNVLINDVPEDDVIVTDPRILSIVLHNLISNAIKYTQNGEIRVTSGVESDWYLLEVSDTGRGMTSAQLEAVRMGTTKHGEISVEDVTAGNGIGLSLVADLIRALHGKWEIDSQESGGVRVRIFISQDMS